MADTPNLPAPCMRIASSQLKLEQVQAAMRAMMAEAQATSATPVCMAIVDASGNLEAFAKMDGGSGVYAAARCPQSVYGGRVRSGYDFPRPTHGADSSPCE